MVSGAIRDKDGATTSYTTRVTVLNVAPVVTPTISGPISVRRGSLVTLTATFTDRAGDGPWTGRVSWGKGQGNGTLGNVVPGTAFAVTNSYTKAGTYQVTIEVRDVHNDTGSAVVTVVVQ